MLHREFAIALALTGLGCTSMRSVQPTQFIPQHNPQSILVTTSDSDVTNVVQPKIDGDTLRGTVAGLQERVAIPLKDILSVRAKAPDGTKTAFLVAGGVVVGGALAYFISQATSSTPVVTTSNCNDPDGC